MRITPKQQKAKADTTEAEGEIAGRTTESSEAFADHFEGVKPGVRPAFQAYLEARGTLAKAFKGLEHEDDEAYKDAQRRYQLCQAATERAMIEREEAERVALDTYKNTVDQAVKNASYAYRESMKQALRECELKTEQIRRTSWQTSAEMTTILNSDDGNTARRKQSHGARLGQEYQSAGIRESVQQWKSRCATFVRQVLRPRSPGAS